MVTQGSLLGTEKVPSIVLKDKDDKVKGLITRVQVLQETDFYNKKPKFYFQDPETEKWKTVTEDDFNAEFVSQLRPVMQIVLTLRTQTGPGRLFLNKWKLKAAKAAIAEASERTGRYLTEFEVGGEFGLKVVQVSGNHRIGAGLYIPPDNTTGVPEKSFTEEDALDQSERAPF